MLLFRYLFSFSLEYQCVCVELVYTSILSNSLFFFRLQFLFFFNLNGRSLICIEMNPFVRYSMDVYIRNISSCSLSLSVQCSAVRCSLFFFNVFLFLMTNDYLDSVWTDLINNKHLFVLPLCVCVLCNLMKIYP